MRSQHWKHGLGIASLDRRLPVHLPAAAAAQFIANKTGD